MRKTLVSPLTLVVLGLLLSTGLYAQTCPGSPNCIVPTFETARTFAVPGNINEVATGDLNNDGNPDMATAGSSGTYVLLGDGAGNFAASVLVNATPSLVLSIGDFNGDGNLDLVNGDAQIFLGNGAGGFSTGPTLAGSDTSRRMGVADFDHDNNLDLLIPVTGTMQFSILYGDGAGGFSSTIFWGTIIVTENPNDTEYNIGMGTVALGDFDGNGSIDVALPIIQGYLSYSRDAIFVNDGSGNFSFGDDLTPNSSFDAFAGDFNGDGNLDLAGPVWSHVGAFASFGDGTGSFTGDNPYFLDWLDPNYIWNGASLKSWLIAYNSSFPHAAVADFNFDGISDLAMWGGGNLHILSYRGEYLYFDGEFTDIVGFDGPAAVSSISVADFNLDGKPDIATANAENGSVSVFLNSPFVVAPLFDTTRAFRRGSTIPIKLALNDGSGANVSSASMALTAYELRLVGGTTSSPVVDSGNANPDYNFRYIGADGGGYIFNLSTHGLGAGTYKLYFYVGNNTAVSYTVQFEIR